MVHPSCSSAVLFLCVIGCPTISCCLSKVFHIPICTQYYQPPTSTFLSYLLTRIALHSESLPHMTNGARILPVAANLWSPAAWIGICCPEYTSILRYRCPQIHFYEFEYWRNFSQLWLLIQRWGYEVIFLNWFEKHICSRYICAPKFKKISSG